MRSASRPVASTQTGVHPRLGEHIRRHSQSPWKKPAQAVDQPALAALDEALDKHTGRLVLDSFCGTGHSTAELARANPEALVVGVDKSAHRLQRHPTLPANALLLQANCEAVWRHLVDEKKTLQAHYLLYPNPWPKASQLGRRIHGHPAFPLLLRLAGTVELRSNWQTYVEEFGVALHLLGTASCVAAVVHTQAPLTLFERKYRDSGHDLWRLSAQLGKL